MSYGDLLKVFWQSHSPEQRPSSRQYMSIIFCHNDEQKKFAFETKAREEERRKARLFTEVAPAAAFTLAEGYHQKYYLRNERDLMREFRAIYPDDAGFVASTAAARVNGYLGGNGTAARLQEELSQLGLSPEGNQRLLGLAKRLPSPRCQYRTGDRGQPLS